MPTIVKNLGWHTQAQIGFVSAIPWLAGFASALCQHYGLRINPEKDDFPLLVVFPELDDDVTSA